MGTKLAPGEFDAYAAALLDEPLFVLLARDSSAPGMLRSWSDRRRSELTKALSENPDLHDDPVWMARYRDDLRKCTSADALADDMQVWRMQNKGVWRDASQARKPLPDIDELAKAEIEAAAVRAVVRVAMCGDAQVEVVEHRVSPWTVPGFAVRRHYFRIHGKGESTFAGFLDNMDPTLPQFQVTGLDVRLGDVLARVKSPTDLRLELQLLVL